MQKPFDICAHLGRDKKHLFQKLLPIEKVDTKKLDFPMYASEKYDGVFCCAILDDEGDVHICSRTGEEFLSMEHLKPYFCWKLTTESFIIFEAYIFGETQNVISGACRDTKKQHIEIVALMHTFAFTKHYDSTEYETTLYGWNKPHDSIGITAVSLNPEVYYINHVKVDSMYDAMKMAEDVWSRGGEGIVLHENSMQPYQFGKRNASIIKIKKVLAYAKTL